VIVAGGIVAKVVAFIAEKCAGKLIALPFDKRKKACRSLTKLYYCTQGLEEKTDSILQYVDSFRDRGHADALINAIISKWNDIVFITNDFIDLSEELEGGLKIIDPALAHCCHCLYRGKFDFLNFLSTSIESRHHGQQIALIIKRPLGRMQNENMESLYQQCKEAVDQGLRHYWPETVLNEFSSDFESVTVHFEDESVALELIHMIIAQNKLLKEAKESLRNLLKESFSIEEILFQSDSQPYR
jgi:hypothetical protein